MKEKIMKAKTMIAVLGIGNGLACAWLMVAAMAAVCSGAQHGIGGVLTAAVTVAAIAAGVRAIGKEIKKLREAYRLIEKLECRLRATGGMDEQEAV